MTNKLRSAAPRCLTRRCRPTRGISPFGPTSRRRTLHFDRPLARRPVRLSVHLFCVTRSLSERLTRDCEPDRANLRVTVSRQSSRGYVWYCALFAVASAVFFVAVVVRWVSEGVELEWWELAWAPAGATLVVGLGVFGAVVHARPLVEEATVREGSLSLVRSRYLRRQTFFGSRADGAPCPGARPVRVRQGRQHLG